MKYKIVKYMKNHKNPFGRKRKHSNEKGIHDKYCHDNLFQKIKLLFIKILKDFINEKIYEIYSGNIGFGFFAKKIFPINKEAINNCKVSFNRALLDKSLGDIFSNKLNNKFSHYKLDHNITIINELKNEPDMERSEKINNLLNLTFLNCLEHFRGSKIYDGLEGLEKRYDEIINDFSKNETDDYLKLIKDMIYNYEKYLYKRESRKSRNKNH